jgi:cell wall assembly regulator SMI1
MAMIPFHDLGADHSVAFEFRRIVGWAQANFPQLLNNLRSGVSDDQLDAAEAELGREMPQQLRELYKLANGEADESIGLFFGLPFIPLDRLKSERASWDKVAEDAGDDPGISEFLTSNPANAIQTNYANKNWLPVSHDWGGNHIGVDIGPGPSGTHGQVINFGRDEDNMIVLASSVGAFLAWLADSLEAGNFKIEIGSQHSPSNVSFRLAEPENQHFLDTIGTLVTGRTV